MLLFGREALCIRRPWSTILIFLSLLFLTQCGKSESRMYFQSHLIESRPFSCFYSRQRTKMQ